MRILHPTDFSQPAQKALRLARDLKERTGGSLHVVHAQRRVESANASARPQLDTLNPEMLNQLAEQRTAEVDRLRGMLSHLASPDGTYELLWGNPVDVVVGPDGAVYVSDDLAGAVYRIAYTGP